MVLKRLRDITVATIHEGLNKIENPVVMLNQYLRDLEEEISRAKDSITKQIMLENIFQKNKKEFCYYIESGACLAHYGVENTAQH